MKDADEFSDITDSEVEEDENAAIIKFVNEMSRARSPTAQPTYIEPQRDSLIIRYRIDGNLVPVRLPENLVKFKDAIISRIKIMARLNISEKRRPQDGRITFNTRNGEEIDIRVSSLPTLYGESVSLRLLSQKSQPVTIEDLGFLPEDVEKIAKPLAPPRIILVTGPTGSGKSTTLTAFIRRLRSPEIRIITVEDPVEYEVEGVNQTQVQPEIGLTFSSVLRSVLRQDPDVIMVGEIRDRETADIAIRASLTGHLVLSTLHTNDAAGALTRLIDMDIEPFLIASSVEMILAQRLVRRLCGCSVPANYDIPYVASCLVSLGINAAEISNSGTIRKPHGCDKCRGIGYYGRVGIFEILLANDDIHAMIVSRKTAQDIRKVAEKHGMRSLQECGWELVKRGMTYDGRNNVLRQHCRGKRKRCLILNTAVDSSGKTSSGVLRQAIKRLPRRCWRRFSQPDYVEAFGIRIVVKRRSVIIRGKRNSQRRWRKRGPGIGKSCTSYAGAGTPRATP
ncbi:MAG: GspE/PulE family protein [Bacilli bacterium]